MYHGDIRLGDTINFKFTTRKFSTGAPFSIGGSPVVSAYPSNSTTELTAGITLTLDFDSRVGLNDVTVVASSGNGYATATNYALVITAGTVDGVSVVSEVVGSFSIEARSALMPTTAARTLVVDAAGLADANVVKVGPTGSGTAQTAGDIMADTNDIQTRLPAALVGGRMDSSVGAMAANVLTAAAINADAITDAKVAADVTIASVTGAVGSVTGSVGSVAAGGIAAASFAAGAIDAAAIATDALGSLELAAGAASEIATAVRTELTTELGRIDVASSTLATAANLAIVDDFLDTEIAAIKAKTDNLPAAPAAVSDIPTAAANADAVWDELLSGHVVSGSAGEALAAATAPSAAAVADAVWDEAIAGHLGAGSTGLALNSAGSAGDPWATAIPGAYGAGTAGKIVGDNINATVSSRATQTSVDDVPTNAELATALGTADDAVLSAVAAVQADTDDIQTRLPAALVGGRMDSSVGAMAANVMTAAAAAADLTTELQTGLATAAALATAQTAIDAIPTNAELATALGTADDAVLAQVALVKGVTDKLDTAVELDGAVYRFTTNALEQAPTGGSAPTAAQNAAAVWDEARASHVAAGSFGQGVASVQGNVTGSVASVVGAVGSVTGAVGSVTGAVGSVTADVGITQAGADKVWASAARSLTTFGTLVADVATAVWGAATRLLTAGTNIVLAKGVGVTGFNDLSAAQVNAEADTALSDVGVTGARMAHLDADVSSRLASASYTAPDNAGIALAVAGASAIFARTDVATSTRAAAGDAMALTVGERGSVADKLLGRNIAGGSDGGHIVTDALRPLRNKTEIVGGTLHVYEEDGTTEAWNAPVTTAPGNPLASVSPV